MEISELGKSIRTVPVSLEIFRVLEKSLLVTIPINNWSNRNHVLNFSFNLAINLEKLVANYKKRYRNSHYFCITGNLLPLWLYALIPPITDSAS